MSARSHSQSHSQAATKPAGPHQNDETTIGKGNAFLAEAYRNRAEAKKIQEEIEQLRKEQIDKNRRADEFLNRAHETLMGQDTVLN